MARAAPGSPEVHDRESLVLFDLHPKRRVRDRRQILRCHDLSTPFRAIVMFTVDMTVSTARVAHIGIAVPSIDAALRFYRDVLGLEPGRPETADGATIVSLALGDVHVELLEPREPIEIGRASCRERV